MMRMGLLMVFSWMLACGNAGGGDTTGGSLDQRPQLAPDQVGILDAISGRIVASDGSALGPGYEIWLLEQTDGGSARFPLDPEGRFRIPLSIFMMEHFYTLHLVFNLQVLGTIDFGESTEGVQGTLKYIGGYGFDAGEIKVQMTRRSEVDRSNPGLVAFVDGGFELIPTKSLTFADLPIPNGVESFAMASQLFAFDPVTLLFGFYRGDSFPQEHADALEQLSRVGVSLRTRREGSVGGVYAGEAPSWLAGSRIAKDDPDATRSMADLWTSSSFAVPVLDAKTYAASIFTGGLPAVSSFAMFRVQATNGALFYVPRLIDRVYEVPPKPIAFATDGADPDPNQDKIDYSKSDGQDGLLNPICVGNQPISFLYEPPRDIADTVVWGSRAAIVDVVIDYYGEGQNGQTTALDAPPGEFSGKFSAAFVEQDLINPTRSWDPDTKTLRFYWQEDVAETMSTVLLRLWSEVLLSQVGGVDVSKIRLRTYFRQNDTPGVAASAIWLRRGC